MAPTDSRPECSFGSSCYRRNPHHFKEYKHHHLAQLLAKHPDLELPGDAGAQLKQQLKIYSDIEHGYNSAVGAPTPRDFLNRVLSDDNKDTNVTNGVAKKTDVKKPTPPNADNSSPNPGPSKRPRSVSPPPPSSSSDGGGGQASKRPNTGEAGGQKLSGVQAV